MTDNTSADMGLSLGEQCRKLNSGEVTARQLVEASLARIADPATEGQRSFLSVASERARTEADRVDQARAAGRALPPLAGVPLAVKDLFDVEGEVTTAGSRALAKSTPAGADATCVRRLRQAGMIVIGRTNMTEFAYSGLGINPHYDTPRSIWRRGDGHIPGGSSSGSAVAVADAQVPVALGTDTGGSCRIPAAFSNLVGYKPTARRIPLDGVVPLAPSLDSIGPIAATVGDCHVVHQLMAGDSPDVNRVTADDRSTTPPGLAGLRLAMLNTVVVEDLDDPVSRYFEAGLGALSSAGVEIIETPIPELAQLGPMNANGGLAAHEAYSWHRSLLADHADEYDPRVRVRIEAGSAVDQARVAEIKQFRSTLMESFETRSVGFDAWILPTVAMLPPRLSDFADFAPGADDELYRLSNLKALRNTSVGNMLDSCAVSLPMCRFADRAEATPVGIMLMAPAMSDDRLLAIAAAIEPVLRSL